MTTPTPPQPPPAPGLVAMLRTNLERAGICLTALGDTMFEYLAAAGPDVRTASVDALNSITPMDAITRRLLLNDPITFAMAVFADPEAASIFKVTTILAMSRLINADVPLLKAYQEYYRSLPDDRKGQGAPECPVHGPESFADKLLKQGQPVPPATKPADDKVTGGEGRKEFLDKKRAEIAARMGVKPEDVIILDEGDLG